MVVGDQDHGILEVAEALLQMTAGPYELIGRLHPHKISTTNES